MNLAAWKARLKETGTPFRQVAGVGELEAVVSGGLLKAAPAAFILPLAEPAGPNERVTAIFQRVGSAVGVVIAVRNVADPAGGAAADDLEAVRAWVRSKLLGWSPAAGYDPAEFGGGRVVTVAGGYLWWQDDFSTAYSIAYP